MNVIEGGVTAAKGFMAATAAAGIKYQNREDMALIFSEASCRSAGTFTKNLVKAAPVRWDQKVLRHSPAVRAIVVNSGIANACTGEEGDQYCMRTAKKAAETAGIPAEEVYVASTGVIGMQLPIERIEAAMSTLFYRLKGSREAGALAAKAIMTTDTVPKEAAAVFAVSGQTATIGGMCKGSGMIHPDMGTMLAFLTTDVSITPELLQEALSADVEDTYNMVSVDGDTSTNDTLLILANGMAGNAEIREKNQDYWNFCEALHYVNRTLARKIAADGEGATALFEAKVIHAPTKKDAVLLSKSIITSSLTKAAIFGHDANWGRILCAMGYSGAKFNPERMLLSFESAAGKIRIFQDGKAVDYSEKEAGKILSEPEVTVVADLMAGEAEAVAWGCDLTYDYVKINADYRS